MSGNEGGKFIERVKMQWWGVTSLSIHNLLITALLFVVLAGKVVFGVTVLI